MRFWLPRSRTSPLPLVAAWAVALGGCGGSADLPDDRIWESEHFRYHTRRTEGAACEAILARLERHFSYVTQLLGLSWPSGRKIDYFKFTSDDDLRSNSECSPGDSCTVNGAVQTSEAFQRHELIHGYLDSERRGANTFLAEGAAVALSCFPVTPTPPTLTAEQALRFDSSEQLEGFLYGAAGWFVSHLLEAYGVERFLELYRSAPSDPTAFRATFQTVYGHSFDAVFSEALAQTAHAGGCLPRWACGEPAIPPDGSRAALAGECGVSGPRSINVGNGGNDQRNVAITLGPVSALMLSCDDSRPWTPRLLGSEMPTANLWSLGEGGYAIEDLLFHGESSGSPETTDAVMTATTLTIAPQPWIGSNCNALAPYEDDAAAEGTTIINLPVVRDASGAFVSQFIKLRYTRPQRVVLAIHQSGSLSLCPTCASTANECQTIGDGLKIYLDTIVQGDYVVRLDRAPVQAEFLFDIWHRPDAIGK